MSSATAQQTSAVYVFTDPFGARAVFNDPADADYVGPLLGDDALTGLDSADVRQFIYDKVQTHGSIALEFFHGNRPITMQGTILDTSVAARVTRENRLRKVVNNCMAADGTLTWTPAGSVSQYVSVRKNQPMRIKGGYAKDYFVSLIAPDPRIYSTTLHTSTVLPATNLDVVNDGNAVSPPALVRITGPGTSPAVKNTIGGTPYVLKFTGLVMTAGQTLDINMLNATAVLSTGASAYAYVDFPANAEWWGVAPRELYVNTVRVDWQSGSTSASTLRIDWRDAWL